MKKQTARCLLILAPSFNAPDQRPRPPTSFHWIGETLILHMFRSAYLVRFTRHFLGGGNTRRPGKPVFITRREILPLLWWEKPSITCKIHLQPELWTLWCRDLPRTCVSSTLL